MSTPVEPTPTHGEMPSDASIQAFAKKLQEILETREAELKASPQDHLLAEEPAQREYTVPRPPCPTPIHTRYTGGGLMGF